MGPPQPSFWLVWELVHPSCSCGRMSTWTKFRPSIKVRGQQIFTWRLYHFWDEDMWHMHSFKDMSDRGLSCSRSCCLSLNFLFLSDHLLFSVSRAVFFELLSLQDFPGSITLATLRTFKARVLSTSHQLAIPPVGPIASSQSGDRPFF